MLSVSKGYWSLIWVGTRSEDREVEDSVLVWFFILGSSTIKQQETTSNLEESMQFLTFPFYTLSWQIPPLRPRQSNITPPLTQSDTISKEFEEISIDDESPKIPRKNSFSQKTSTLKKVSVSPIVSGRLQPGVGSTGQRHNFFLHFLFSILERHLGEKLPFLAFDLQGGLHFLSNSTSQISSL